MYYILKNALDLNKNITNSVSIYEAMDIESRNKNFLPVCTLHFSINNILTQFTQNLDISKVYK